MKNRPSYYLFFYLFYFSFFTCFLFGASSSDASFNPSDEGYGVEMGLIPSEKEPSFTINFNNVSIIEYIKFVSKISKLNFIYKENELNFNVTIVSEEPTSLANVKSALVQVLKINGFGLIEQGNNVIITSSEKGRQIATVVSKENPLEKGAQVPPIVTRVFKINNANPSLLGRLLTPLLSQDAILEVSSETRRMIITDITQNIEQVQKLMLSLDVPKAPFNIDSYVTKNNVPSGIIPFAKQIIEPLSEGNPVIFVGQKETNTIFVVSTPFLIEKALMILEDLDSPPSLTKRFQGPMTGQNVLLYHIQNKSAEVLQAGVQEIVQHLQELGPSSQDLVQTLQSMRYIRQSHSLFFTGDSESLTEVKSILISLDMPFSKEELEFDEGQFYIYPIQNGTEEQIKASLEKFVSNLKDSAHPDEGLIKAIEKMKWIKENNSLMFTGDQASLDKLSQVLPTFDTPFYQGKTASRLPLSNDFYVYHPKFQDGKALLHQVQDVYSTLKNAGLSDPAFLNTLNSAKWVSSTNSLIFTGDTSSLDRIHALMGLMDYQEVSIPKENQTIYMYQIQYNEPKYVEEGLKKIANSLPSDEDFVHAIDNMKYVSQSKTFIFRALPETIERIKKVLLGLDSSKLAESEATYTVYKLKNAKGSFVLRELEQTAKTLSKGNVKEKDLIQAIQNIQWNEKTNSLVLTGSPDVLEKLKLMIAEYDIPHEEGEKTSQFFVYRNQAMPMSEFQKVIFKAADEMESSGLQDPSLIKALRSAKIISDGEALIFTGTPKAITKLHTVLPNLEKQAQKPNQVYLFTPKIRSPKEIIQEANQTASEMESSHFADSALILAFRSGKIVGYGKSVLFTGTPDAIEKIQEMIPTFDIGKKEMLTSEFFVYKPQNISAQELQKHAETVAKQMKSSGLSDPDLIRCLSSTKLVSHDAALLFTGTAESIEKLKELLPSLDQFKETDIKQPAKTSFFIYKIKYVSGGVLMNYLRSMAADLQRAGSGDIGVIHALNNMRYVKKTNAIIFTGTPSVLDHVKKIIVQFDVPAMSQEEEPIRSVSGFLIYSPKYIPGQQLIAILRDFEQNLLNSGIEEPDLFDVINNLKWMDSTASILISGDEASNQRVLEILERFDTPQKGSSQEPKRDIEHFDDLSFLIYKLQYHSGVEIQSSLQLIGQELSRIKGDQLNHDLVESIQALQWVEVTNSLITTGKPATLAKLRELIKSIDIPLTQVFVEVLVIETNLSNSLNFGLRWGSQGNYRDKFAYGVGAYPQSTQTFTDELASFNKNLSSISATTTPTGTMFDPASGFSLGVIGDIILHKGKSYFALGSLIDAIQGDSNSTVALNQKVITQDNKNSTLFVGQNVPYTGSIITSTSNTITSSSNLEYRDVGVSLSITPQVSGDNLITLNINEEISEVISRDDESSTSSDSLVGITTNKTTTQTQVTLPDRSFLVLSGQINNSKSTLSTGIPCLGGLPVVGAAFQQNDTLKNNTCILIFVRPHIVKSFEEYKKITKRQEDLHRHQTDDEESYDEGLELVKTPDDY